MLADKHISRPPSGRLLREFSITDGLETDKKIVHGRVISSKLPTIGGFELSMPSYSSSSSSSPLKTRKYPWHEEHSASDTSSSSICGAYSQPGFVFQHRRMHSPTRKAYPCSNGASTPKKSNTAKSYSNWLLFGDDEQGEEETRNPSTAFPSSSYEVDSPSATVTKKPLATLDAQIERDSWASGELTVHLEPERDESRQPSPPHGLVGRLQTEVSILHSFAEVPFSFDEHEGLEEVEGAQEVLRNFFQRDEDQRDYYRTKPKQNTSFKTASTDSTKSDSIGESVTRFYRERPQIARSLLLTDIFSWNKEGSKTVTTKKNKEKNTSTTKKATRSTKHTLIDLDTGLPPDCKHVQLDESLYSLHTPSMIESSCSCDSEDEESTPPLPELGPLQLTPALTSSIRSNAIPDTSPSDCRPQGFRRDSHRYGEC